MVFLLLRGFCMHRIFCHKNSQKFRPAGESLPRAYRRIVGVHALPDFLRFLRPFIPENIIYLPYEIRDGLHSSETGCFYI